MVDLDKRLAEVDQILRELAKSERKKIPVEIYRYIDENKDENHDFVYDKTEPLEKQKIHRDTLVILSYININFLLTDEQAELLKEIHKQNESKVKKIEENMAVGIETLNLNKEEHSIHRKETAIAVQEDNIIKKILTKIKNFLSKAKSK